MTYLCCSDERLLCHRHLFSLSCIFITSTMTQCTPKKMSEWINSTGNQPFWTWGLLHRYSHTKRYQFDFVIWNHQFSQFVFSYILIFYTHLFKNADDDFNNSYQHISIILLINQLFLFFILFYFFILFSLKGKFFNRLFDMYFQPHSSFFLDLQWSNLNRKSELKYELESETFGWNWDEKQKHWHIHIIRDNANIVLGGHSLL